MTRKTPASPHSASPQSVSPHPGSPAQGSPESGSPAPTFDLPPNPSLEQLKKQAKDLLAAARSGDQNALATIQRYVPTANIAVPALHDAQTALSRSYGFSSWAKLRSHLQPANVAELAEAVRSRNSAAVRKLVRSHPELVNCEVPGHGEHRVLHFAVLNRDEATARTLLSAGADPHIGIYPFRDATTAFVLAKERGYTEILTAMEEEEQRRREAMSCPNATVSPAQDRLAEAIRRGDQETVERMVEEDPTLLKACDREGANPAHLAASALHPELLRWLLDRYNAVRKEDRAGRTPMDRAALAVETGTLGRFREVVRWLQFYGSPLTARAAVALGAAAELKSMLTIDPDAYRRHIDWKKGGLLSLAVRLNDATLVRLLLDLGLDPNEPIRVDGIEDDVFSYGAPLSYAAGDAQYEIAEMLLEAGAQPNAMVYASGDAVSSAFNARDERMKQLLGRYGGKADPATIGSNGDLEAARELLAEIDRNDETRSSSTGEDRTRTEELLWAAACGGFPEIVKLCLSRIDWAPGDPRWFDMMIQPLRIWGHHPHRRFRDVDRSAYPACLNLILDAGANPNLQGRLGQTVLHDIAASGVVWGQPIMTENERETFARLVLDAGARLDIRDQLLCSTPLAWAARWGRKGLVELLLDSGAPAEEPDAEPWTTPLAWAQKRGHAEIEAILRSHGASTADRTV